MGSNPTSGTKHPIDFMRYCVCVSITVCIPSLPERTELRARALRSIDQQTLQPNFVRYVIDHDRQGEHITRNSLLAEVQTKYVVFLDDDDELKPTYLETVYSALIKHDADLVYCNYEVIGGGDHRPTFIQCTNLMKTEVARSVGGFPAPFSDTFPYRYSDWGFLAKLLVNGAKFHYVSEPLWYYHIHGGNTVGVGF